MKPSCSATNFLLEQEEVKPSFDHVDMEEQCSSGHVSFGQNDNNVLPLNFKSASEPSSRSESPVFFCRGSRSRSHSPSGRNIDINRKRAREPSTTQPPLSPQESPQKQQKSEEIVPMDISKILVNVEDFECSLCYRLLYEPVTTPLRTLLLSSLSRQVSGSPKQLSSMQKHIG